MRRIETKRKKKKYPMYKLVYIYTTHMVQGRQNLTCLILSLREN